MALARVALCALACVGLAAAWGSQGHQIVADIATSQLDSDVASAVNDILNGQSLYDVANWADTIRSQPAWAWSGPLHYADAPAWACDFVFTRDCATSECVVGAIQNYTKRLGNQQGDEQTIALKFITHFLGDIHQPLHVGFASDQGGNLVKGKFFGYDDSLHEMWDTWIPKYRMRDDFNGDQRAYTDFLIDLINSDWAANATAWADCNANQCADEWADESAKAACDYAYTDENGNKIKNGFVLAQAYQDFAVPVIDVQLAKGGVRLAMVLENVLSSLLPNNNAADRRNGHRHRHHGRRHHGRRHRHDDV